MIGEVLMGFQRFSCCKKVETNPDTNKIKEEDHIRTQKSLRCVTTFVIEPVDE